MKRRLRPAVLTTLVVMVLAGLGLANSGFVAAAGARRGLDSQEDGALSSFWSPRIQQWASLIAQEAERRDLDPDFLASLVWMESRGDAEAVGPVGAVGLMQVMPKEAGFAWRPTHDELVDPETNLFWGARTLATVVKQGKGDIFNALAAYNGGWEQIMYRGPKYFATTILRDYAEAVAIRHGLESGDWVAFFAVDQGQIVGPIWVADADRDDVYIYGDTNLTPEGGRLIPRMAPTAVVGDCGEEGTACAVGLWLYHEAEGRWIGPSEIVVPPAPTPTLLTALPRLVMAGSERPVGWSDVTSLLTATEPTAVPTATAVPAAQATPDATVAASAVSSALAAAAPATEVAPSGASVDEAGQQQPTETPVSVPACSGEDLRVDAWPLERVNTPDNGWKVLIYAEGHGGDCLYTYAWNDDADVRAVHVRDSVAFWVTSPRRDAVILGTVVVTSGGETQRVGMYVNPPRP